MTPFSLSFQKDSRPRTLAVDPLDFDLFIQCLVTADHPGSSSNPRCMCSGCSPALGMLKQESRELEATLSYRAKPFQNVKKKAKRNQDKDPWWRLDSNDQIVIIRSTYRKALHRGKHSSSTSERYFVLHLGLLRMFAQDPSESCSGQFCTMPYFYHKIQGRNHQLWKPEHLESSFKETPQLGFTQDFGQFVSDVNGKVETEGDVQSPLPAPSFSTKPLFQFY